MGCVREHDPVDSAAIFIYEVNRHSESICTDHIPVQPCA